VDRAEISTREKAIMEHFSRRRGRITALVICWAAASALVVRAGDSEGSDRAATTDATTRRSATSAVRDADTTAAAPVDVDVCALMPLHDVAIILAPALALQRAPKPPSMDRGPDMCHYIFPVDRLAPNPPGPGPQVQLLLEVTDMGTVKNARDSFRNGHQMAVDRPGLMANIAALGGFGDEAFVSDETGTFSAGITVRRGSLITRANLAVDETEFSFRLPLAEALMKELLKRVP
jgi:hypothetical protein